MGVSNLFTKEDYLHLHKILGFLALISFFWRTVHFGENDMGFAKYPQLTGPTILLHLFLNLSAFEFRIPKKRIADGSRIWPEYRFHSLVFACRSLVTMAVTWIEQLYGLDPNYSYNFAIVMTSMACAYLSSHFLGGSQSTIRKLAAPKSVRFLFSAMQLKATAGMMIGLRRMSLPFLMLMIIQGNAFNMTLRRKNVINTNGMVGIYAVMLIIGAIVGGNELMELGETGRLVAELISNLAILIRLAPLPAAVQPLQNKYIMWTVLSYLCFRLRPLMDGDEANSILTSNQVYHACALTFPSIAALGYYKTNYCYNESEPRSIAKEGNKSD